MTRRLTPLLLATLVAACSTERNIELDYRIDADLSPPASADAGAMACQDLLEDGRPPAVETIFDGIWTTVGESHDGVMDIGCSSDGVHALRHYLRIAPGAYESYQRLYDSSEECMDAAFDEGGVVHTVAVSALTPCPGEYIALDGQPTRQVALVTLVDDVEPEAAPPVRYFFLKLDAPGAAYHQLSHGKTESTDGPLVSPETTTAWRTYRRPAAH